MGDPDEIDMQITADGGGAEVLRIKGVLPATGESAINNYGKGVMFWESDAQAARYVNASTWCRTTSTGSPRSDVCGAARVVHSSAGAEPDERRMPSCIELRGRRSPHAASGCAWRVEEPVWTFVEVGHPFTTQRGRAQRSLRPRCGLRCGTADDRRCARHRLLQSLLRRACAVDTT